MPCGICGVINFKGLTKENLEYFTKVLLRSQDRGRDASGVANQELSLVKTTEEADKLVQTQQYKDFLSDSIGLKYVVGHTRKATRGTPQDNRNNHPITAKEDKFLMVHNGIVGSSTVDDDPSITDSYVIAKAIRREWRPNNLFKSVQEAYRHFWGFAAIAVVTPREIVLARRSNPLVYGWKNGAMYFASEEDFIEETNNKVEMRDSSLIRYTLQGKSRMGKLEHVRRKYTQNTYDKAEKRQHSWFEDMEYVTDKSGTEQLKLPEGRGWFNQPRKHRDARMKGLRKRYAKR